MPSMPWHGFKKGEPYNRDHVIAECEKRIESGKVKNQPDALNWLEDIRTCSHETLVWRPTKSHRRCPWNAGSWETPTGESLCEPRVHTRKG